MNISKILVIISVLALHSVSCSPLTKNIFGRDISNRTSNSERNVTTRYVEKNQPALGENRKISLFGLQPSKYVNRAISEKLPSHVETRLATPREKLKKPKDIVRKNKFEGNQKKKGRKVEEEHEPTNENVPVEEEEISEEEKEEKKENDEESTKDEVDSEEEMDDEKENKPIEPTSVDHNTQVTEKGNPVLSNFIKIVWGLLFHVESCMNGIVIVRNFIHNLRAFV